MNKMIWNLEMSWYIHRKACAKSFGDDLHLRKYDQRRRMICKCILYVCCYCSPHSIVVLWCLLKQWYLSQENMDNEIFVTLNIAFNESFTKSCWSTTCKRNFLWKLLHLKEWTCWFTFVLVFSPLLEFGWSCNPLWQKGLRIYFQFKNIIHSILQSQLMVLLQVSNIVKKIRHDVRHNLFNHTDVRPTHIVDINVTLLIRKNVKARLWEPRKFYTSHKNCKFQMCISKIHDQRQINVTIRGGEKQFPKSGGL